MTQRFLSIVFLVLGAACFIIALILKVQEANSWVFSFRFYLFIASFLFIYIGGWYNFIKNKPKNNTEK